MKLNKHYCIEVFSCSMFFLKDILYENYHKFRCNKFSILLNFVITALDSIRERNAFFFKVSVKFHICISKRIFEDITLHFIEEHVKYHTQDKKN